MKNYSRFIVLLLSSLFLMLPMQTSAETADDGGFVNSIYSRAIVSETKNN